MRPYYIDKKGSFDMSIVSLVKTDDTVVGFKESISQAISLIDYTIDKKIKKIVIKPNLCYYWDYSTGNTTDPRFVLAVINLIKESASDDVQISVIESDASAMKTKHAFRFLGYEKVLEKSNVNLVNLSDKEYETIDVKIMDEEIKIRVPEIIKNADLKINVPKIKYMGEGIKITCALKNIFGCIPQSRKYKYHNNLAKTIIAANKAMKFDLTIIDSNIASGVRPKKIGLVAASDDPVANDVVASKIARVNPNSISYLKLAQKEGLGEFNYKIAGESLEYFRKIYPYKTLEDHFWSSGYKLYKSLYK
ncbi:MAG: DUF362 domain-containing protein [Candidatus Thorarchaeota archaeon]